MLKSNQGLTWALLCDAEYCLVLYNFWYGLIWGRQTYGVETVTQFCDSGFERTVMLAKTLHVCDPWDLGILGTLVQIQVFRSPLRTFEYWYAGAVGKVSDSFSWPFGLNMSVAKVKVQNGLCFYAFDDAKLHACGARADINRSCLFQQTALVDCLRLSCHVQIWPVECDFLAQTHLVNMR